LCGTDVWAHVLSQLLLNESLFIEGSNRVANIAWRNTNVERREIRADWLSVGGAGWLSVGGADSRACCAITDSSVWAEVHELAALSSGTSCDVLVGASWDESCSLLHELLGSAWLGHTWEDRGLVQVRVTLGAVALLSIESDSRSTASYESQSVGFHG